MTDIATKSKPRAAPLWMWLVWLALSTLAWGGVAMISLLFGTSLDFAHVSLVDYPWIYRLRLEVMPVIGVVALAAPLVGAVALVWRRWRPAALALIFAAALAQYAYVGLEFWFKAQPAEPPSLPGWDEWPVR
jgi:hypothetical protein